LVIQRPLLLLLLLLPAGLPAGLLLHRRCDIL
jgi:hypothetical protein